MSKSIFKTIACLGLAAAACTWGFSGPGEDHTGASESALIQLLPTVSGWAFSEDPEIFRPESLYEYINGAAEGYLSYNFLELAVGQYEGENNQAFVTLEIYDMGSDLNAFGIFSAERYPESPSVEIGSLGYIDGEVLNFVSDRYYVKLLAFGTGDDTSGVLKTFAAATAAGMPAAGDPPAALRAFPEEGLVQNSEKYVKSNFMGFSFLENGYLAAYKAEGREYDAFLVPAAGEAEAEDMFRRLIAFYEKDGEMDTSGEGRVRLKNRYGQILLLGRVSQVLCGVTRLSEELEPAGEKTLGLLMENLRSMAWE